VTAAPPRIVLYTDGGCRGNPGIGGWGFLLIDRSSGQALERRGGEDHTTNNRMEITAALEGLQTLEVERLPVEVRSDSRYLVDMCRSWIAGWKKRGWRRRDGPVQNLDLVQELDRQMERLRIRWVWVRAHAGEPGNEYVDRLTNDAMDAVAAGESPAYEQRHAASPVSI